MLDQAALEQLRTEALADVETHAKNPRFDLFSQPPPLCIGDSSYKKSHRSSLLTQPRETLKTCQSRSRETFT